MDKLIFAEPGTENVTLVGLPILSLFIHSLTNIRDEFILFSPAAIYLGSPKRLQPRQLANTTMPYPLDMQRTVVKTTANTMTSCNGKTWNTSAVDLQGSNVHHTSSKMAAITTSLNLVWDDLDCETSNCETKCNWPSTIAKCHTLKKNLLFRFLLPNISFGIKTCLSFCKRFYWHQKRAFLPLFTMETFQTNSGYIGWWVYVVDHRLCKPDLFSLLLLLCFLLLTGRRLRKTSLP